LTNAAAVVTIGKITGGVRSNIIPETVEMQGTIRTLDGKMQELVHAKIKQIAENIATGMGVKADVQITKLYPVTYNDPKLTAWAAPFIERVTGKEKAKVIPAVTGAEDFSFYAQKVPGFFFFVGGMPLNADPNKTSAHHTPDFYIDESGMLTGLKAMLNLTVEYLNKK
jgi:amidohydrolase